MEHVAYARVVWGRWVADCPRDGCTQAEHFGQDPWTSHVGGLAGDVFRCGTEGVSCGCGRVPVAGCGLVCRAVWPANVEAIEKLLMQRPAQQTRNWSPGEDLTGLLLENIAHGIAGIDRDEIEAGHPSVQLLQVCGDDIVTDRLALSAHAARRALGRG